VRILYDRLFAGDPTTFGNLKPPKEVIEAVQESIASQLYNGYAPSTGKLEERYCTYLFIVPFSLFCVILKSHLEARDANEALLRDNVSRT